MLKHCTEYKLGTSEMKHLLKDPAKLGWKKKKKEDVQGKSSCSSGSEKQKSVFSTKVKSLKKHPYLRGTMEITAQTSPITYVK